MAYRNDEFPIQLPNGTWAYSNSDVDAYYAAQNQAVAQPVATYSRPDDQVDPLVTAANEAGAQSGHEVIDGKTYYWFKDINNPGIPTEGSFIRDGKIYVTPEAFLAAHPRQDSWADSLWMLPMAGLGGITAGAAFGGAGAAEAAGGAGAATGGGAGGVIGGTGATAGTFGPYASAAAADAAGLAQMGAAAGLSGDALAAFVAAGGAASLAPFAGMSGFGPIAKAALGAGTAATGLSTLENILKSGGSLADWSKIISALGPAALGYFGADKQSDSLTDISNQLRADRAPALSAFNNALANPNEFYNSAPAMGSVDAILRKLSMEGNPANNPGSLAKAAAYNLGGYNDYLKTLSGPAFGTAGAETNVNVAGAGADAGKMNSIGYGVGQLFNPQPSIADLAKQYGLNIGGVSYRG